MVAIVINFEEARKRLRPRAEDYFAEWAKQTFTSSEDTSGAEKYLEGYSGNISGNICASDIFLDEEKIYESLSEMTHINDLLKLYGDKYNRDEDK